jgi:hypothetical protein
MARDGVDDTQTADADATTSRRAFTAVEDADGDSERQCSVCMSDFTQRVLLKECGHPFWYDNGLAPPIHAHTTHHLTSPARRGGAVGKSRFGGVATRPVLVLVWHACI